MRYARRVTTFVAPSRRRFATLSLATLSIALLLASCGGGTPPPVAAPTPSVTAPPPVAHVEDVPLDDNLPAPDKLLGTVVIPRPAAAAKLVGQVVGIPDMDAALLARELFGYRTAGVDFSEPVYFGVYGSSVLSPKPVVSAAVADEAAVRGMFGPDAFVGESRGVVRIEYDKENPNAVCFLVRRRAPSRPRLVCGATIPTEALALYLGRTLPTQPLPSNDVEGVFHAAQVRADAARQLRQLPAMVNLLGDRLGDLLRPLAEAAASEAADVLDDLQTLRVSVRLPEAGDTSGAVQASLQLVMAAAPNGRKAAISRFLLTPPRGAAAGVLPLAAAPQAAAPQDVSALARSARFSTRDASSLRPGLTLFGNTLESVLHEMQLDLRGKMLPVLLRLLDFAVRGFAYQGGADPKRVAALGSGASRTSGNTPPGANAGSGPGRRPNDKTQTPKAGQGTALTLHEQIDRQVVHAVAIDAAEGEVAAWLTDTFAMFGAATKAWLGKAMKGFGAKQKPDDVLPKLTTAPNRGLARAKHFVVSSPSIGFLVGELVQRSGASKVERRTLHVWVAQHGARTLVVWGDDEDAAFASMKQALSGAPNGATANASPANVGAEFQLGLDAIAATLMGDGALAAGVPGAGSAPLSLRTEVSGDTWALHASLPVSATRDLFRAIIH
jgi:hypothetical protein